MSVKGPDSNSISQAVSDLEAMDTRLAALVAAYPRAEAGEPDLAAPIRESRELVRTIIELLAGAQSPNGMPNEAPEQAIGGAKRRVKIKAASETTAGSGAARVEAAARSGAAASKASAKVAARGGDGAGSASAATAAATVTAKAPTNSLLARLGAATPEPGTLRRVAADSDSPASATAGTSVGVPAFNTADRLARLEAEIDSLTEASIAVSPRSDTAAPEKPAPPTATKGSEARARRRDSEATPASTSERRPDVGTEGAGDDEDDAEIVIVTAESKAGGAGRATPSTRQNPRTFRDPPLTDEDDAEVEIVRPGTRPDLRQDADGQEARTPVKPESGRARSGATAPTAPAKWRLFRGSR